LDVNDIREAFSKAQTVITDRGISIIYSYKDGWIDQEFADDKKSVLLKLIRMSDWVNISFIKGRMFKFVFHNNIDGQETVIYAPVKEENSLFGLENIFDAIEFGDVDVRLHDEFLEFFDGCDLDDSDDVLDRFTKLIEAEEARRPNIIKIETIKRFSDFAKVAKKFADSVGLRCELSKPDSDFEGSATLFFETHANKSICLKGKQKDLFEQLVEMSPVVMFECAITEGYANFSFY